MRVNGTHSCGHHYQLHFVQQNTVYLAKTVDLMHFVQQIHLYKPILPKTSEISCTKYNRYRFATA